MTPGDEPPPAAPPTIRVFAMPADTNPDGDIFGGWLLSIMDQAGGSVAALHSRGRVATVALDGMSFHRPVAVGDEVSVYAELIATGTSSMKIDVAAWRRAAHEDRSEKVTHARFTFVAVGANGRPRPVPALGG